ncbi:MAG TPA: glycosyltransferase [Gaiellaceae bacterium]|nr:glycosyltransferase [Gaiellaceae bacterium]
MTCPTAPSRGRTRLGVYVDTAYARTADGIAADPVDASFLLFVLEVGRRFDRVVLLGRVRAGGEGFVPLPAGAEVAALPDYPDLRRLGAVLRASAGTLRAFWRAADDVDLVWAFGPHPFALALVAVARLRGKRVALGVRQDSLGYFRSRLPGAAWWPLLAGVHALDATFRLLARRLPTTVVGEAIAERYGGGPTVLPMAVSVVRAADVVPEPREKDWDGQVELLTVGRLEPEKHPLLLVDALAGLDRRRPGRYRLAWIGTGRLGGDVRRRADELGIGRLVELPGHVPLGEGLLERYRRAHVFVHVSLTEGVPQVLLEALASGTGVVATDVGGVAGALDHGAAGLLVPPSDADALVAAVERIVDDRGLRDRLVARGLELARRRTLESEAERVAAHLEPSAHVPDR